MQHIKDHADEYQVDAKRLGIYGGSAGGQLALIELARILFRSRSFELPESYRLPEPEAGLAPEPVRVVIGQRPERGTA